jgi:hypothetical protein
MSSVYEKYPVAVGCAVVAVGSYVTVRIARSLWPSFDGTCFTLTALGTGIITGKEGFGLGALTKCSGEPTSINSPNPIWLTKVLRKSGAITTSSVTVCTASPFSAGQTADSARVSLTYDKKEPGMEQPSSVVIKMSREDIEGKVINQLMGLWRECEFYLQYGSAVPKCMTIAKCYYGTVSWFNRDFCLVLSDMSIVDGKQVEADILTPAEFGRKYDKYNDKAPDASVKPAADIAELTVAVPVVIGVVQKVASMHAKFWNDSTLRLKVILFV